MGSSSTTECSVRSNGEYDRMLGTSEWGVRPNVEYDRMLSTIEMRVQANGIKARSNGIQLMNE